MCVYNTSDIDYLTYIDTWDAQVTMILGGKVREVVIMVEILGETINLVRQLGDVISLVQSPKPPSN